MQSSALSSSEYEDLQGLVLSGYGNLHCSRFVFLRIVDPPIAREWLRALVPAISTSAYRPKSLPKPHTAINIAFTWRGLRALDLQADALNAFPREFQQGMAGGERPRVLGDTEASDPANWDFGGPNRDPIDIALLLYGETDRELVPLYSAQLSTFEAGGVKEVYSQDTGRISEKEPFGFRDGISQPFIAGSFGAVPTGQTPIKAGEFLLGYFNEYDNVTPSPVVPATADPGNLLTPVDGTATRAFGRNGSYLIFRKLAQNTHGFEKFAREQAALDEQPPSEQHVKWVKAKMVGRWPDGAPLVLSPNAEDHALGADPKRNNDFNYMDADPNGFRCPVGSHIRRSNPRDSLPPNPAASIGLSQKHRLLRRGRHYEDHNRTDTWDANGVEHGLCFIALNADIQRQFEFVQQTWINSPKFNGLFDNKDPLVGDNDGTGHMTIQASPVRRHLNGIPRFVQTRGGEYFFLPSMRALRYLASPIQKATS